MQMTPRTELRTTRHYSSCQGPERRACTEEGKSLSYRSRNIRQARLLPTPILELTLRFFATALVGIGLNLRYRSSFPSIQVRLSIFVDVCKASYSRENTSRQTRHSRPYQTRRRQTANRLRNRSRIEFPPKTNQQWLHHFRRHLLCRQL